MGRAHKGSETYQLLGAACGKEFASRGCPRSWNMYLKSDVLTGAGECQDKLEQLGHQSEHVCWVTQIYAWQHPEYHLSLSESDRLRLVLRMFTKLILLWVMTT
jgi:hypothetical protein